MEKKFEDFYLILLEGSKHMTDCSQPLIFDKKQDLSWQMLKQPSLKSWVLYISVFQDKPDKYVQKSSKIRKKVENDKKTEFG